VIANGVAWTYRDGGPLPAPYKLENMPEGWLDAYIAEPTGKPAH
jgi:hypothetical protein